MVDPNQGTLTQPHLRMGDYCLSILTHAGWRPEGGPIQSLAFTSVRPKAGVTTLLIESAKVAADHEQRVLLVNCNRRAGRLEKIFGFRNPSGLCDALDNLEILESSIQDTAIPGLSVLPAGKQYSTDAVDRESIVEIVNLLTGEFDLVLFDMPVVQSGGAINNCYRELDGTLLVVAQGELTSIDAELAQRELFKAGAKVLGIVLNKGSNPQ